MLPKSSKNPTRTKCCVEGCATRICSGVPMHGFPRIDRYPELYQHWLDAVRLANKTPSWVPLKSHRVCAFHFETVENCRIRVPTIFPNVVDTLPSTFGEQDDDFDENEDPTQHYDGDLIDAHEASIAAKSIIPDEDSSTVYENNRTSEACDAFFDEDSAMTYDEVEERYNAIVGDVVSTLKQDGEVAGEDTSACNDELTYDSEEEHPAIPNSEDNGFEEENDVVEEVIYDDHVLEEENNPKVQTEVFTAEQLGLKQEELGGREYCVLVVNQCLDGTNQASPEKLSARQIPTGSTPEKITAKKSIVHESGKKGNHIPDVSNQASSEKVSPSNIPAESNTKEDTAKKNIVQNSDKSNKKKCISTPGKAARKSPKTLPAVSAPVAERSPEEGIPVVSDRVKRRLLGDETPLTDGIELPEPEAAKTVRSPSKKAQIEDKGKSLKKSPVKLNGEWSPGKGKEKDLSPGQGKDKDLSPGKCKDEESPSESQYKEISAETTVVKENRIMEPNEDCEKDKSPKKLLVKSKSPQKASDEIEEKRKTWGSVNVKELNGLKIDGLFLDGEPVKLRECSVSIEKTPFEALIKKKALNTAKAKEVVKKIEPAPSGSKELDTVCNDVEADDPPNVLNALSLRNSKEVVLPVRGDSGLRRSARIRAGGGKRRKFGVERSWSVGLKNPPKKKPKRDEGSEFPEFLYDFEDEDDPEVGISDLEESDTTVSESESDFSSRSERRKRKSARTGSESDMSSRSESVLKRNPQPRLNGATGQGSGLVSLQDSRNKVLNPEVGSKKTKFVGYHRVRRGEQATQVGLPGKCDSFVFEVDRYDTRNVGVSCNIFYNYQSTISKPYLSTWTRFKPKVKTLTVAKDISRKITQSPNGSRETRAKSKHGPKLSKVDPPAAIQRKNRHTDNTEDSIEVVDDDREQPVVSEEHGNSMCTEDPPPEIEIKVEPAMDFATSVTGDGESHETDANSTAGTAVVGDVEVKEEEECQNDQCAVGQSPFIVTSLCDVGIAVGGRDSSSAGPNALSELGEARRDEPMENDADDASPQDVSTKQFSPIAGKHTEVETEAGIVDVAMDSSDTRPHDENESAKGSERKESLINRPNGASSSSKEKLSYQDGLIEDTALPLRECSNPGNGADSCVQDHNSDVNRSSIECRSECADQSSMRKCIDSTEVLERATTPGTAKKSAESPSAAGNSHEDIANSAEYPSEAEVPREYARNLGENAGSNASADTEKPGDYSSELRNFPTPSELPTDVALCESRLAGESSKDSGGILAEARSVQCLDGMVEADAELSPNAAVGGMKETGCNGEYKDPGDTLVRTEWEAEFQGDVESSFEDKVPVERTNSPDFSSDSSNDFIEVPIPDIGESNVSEPVALPANIVSAKLTFPQEERSHARPAVSFYRPQAVGGYPSEPTVQYHPSDVGGESPASSSETRNNHPEVRAGSPRLFENIERDLEKMFEMDS